MDKVKEIIKILNSNEFGELALTNKYITGVKTEHFKQVAEEIVKLFDIPDVIASQNTFKTNKEKFRELVSSETSSWLKDAKRRQRRKFIARLTLYPRIYYYTLKRNSFPTVWVWFESHAKTLIK